MSDAGVKFATRVKPVSRERLDMRITRMGKQ